MLRSGKISEQQLEDEKKAWEERGLERKTKRKRGTFFTVRLPDADARR